MSNLPSHTYPSYKTVVPSTNQPIRFRPYNAAEEKIFLHAAESADTDQIKTALVQVLGACTYGEVKIENLTTFDIEWLFLLVRAQSIGEELAVAVQITECPENGQKLCKTTNKLQINLKDVKLVVHDADGKPTDFMSKPFRNTAKIVINKDMAITMRYPTFPDLDLMSKYVGIGPGNVEDLDFDLMARCAVSIFKDNTLYECNKSSQEDLKNWFFALDKTSLKPIKEFLKNIPIITYTAPITCSKCGVVREYTLSGLNDFFD